MPVFLNTVFLPIRYLRFGILLYTECGGVTNLIDINVNILAIISEEVALIMRFGHFVEHLITKILIVDLI